MKLLNEPVSFQSVLLSVIVLADLLSTILLLEYGLAVEANPLMRALLPHGWLVFSLVKCSTLVGFLMVLTWYRRRRPRAAALVETCTAAGYVVMYTGLFSLLNL